ncbi:NADH-quinone oxidoreductase subunit C [Streptomyces sp. SGAir0957]
MSWLPDPVEELFGDGATVEEAYDLLTVDVPAASWTTALDTARTRLGCTYFDWLSAVDEPGTGFRVCAHVAAVAPGSVRRLLLRTTVPHSAPVLASAIDVYAGAAWHERETHEMFGVTFEGHPHLVPLLLPDGFEGHPLRKDFVLAARVAKAWPGAKEPGESSAGAGAGHTAPKRRQMLPPGVPDPNEWGPLKGQLPPAPTRPARGAARAGTASAPEGAGAARPVRRARSASEGSASQATGAGTGAGTGGASAPEGAGAARPARRSRSASEGSASQATGTGAGAGTGTGAASPAEPGPARPARRARSVSEGSASQRPAAPEKQPEPEAPAKPRPSDAPWHHAKPAFDEPPQPPRAPSAGPETGPDAVEPDAAAPDAPGPDAAEPDATTPVPDAAEPDATTPVPDAAEPDAPAPDAPAPDATTSAPDPTTPERDTPAPTKPDPTPGGTP